MKRSILILILFFSCQFAYSQIKPLTVDQFDKRISLGKDTTYIVNFWATWCGPCIAELPYFEQVNAEYKNKKVKVLLVSLDFKSKLEKDVVPFVKKMKLKSEVFILDETNQQKYIDRISTDWSGAIPATIFINNEKKIRNFYEKEFTHKELVTTLEGVFK